MDGYFKGEDTIDVTGKNLMSKNIKSGKNVGKVIEPFSFGPTFLIYGNDGKINIFSTKIKSIRYET